jgi:hypothetical protein
MTSLKEQMKGAVMRNRAGFLNTSAIGSLLLALSIASPAIAEKDNSDMRSMKQMMGECREHHYKAAKAIDQMLLKMREARQSNESAKMRTALEESQTNLAGLKQDMAVCMNMMSMMEQMDGGMREHMRGMMERKDR